MLNHLDFVVWYLVAKINTRAMSAVSAPDTDAITVIRLSIGREYDFFDPTNKQTNKQKSLECEILSKIT